MVQIHNYALRILSTTGLRVDSQRARAVFARAGSQLRKDGILRIPPELVEQALQTAPRVVEVYNRRGNPAFKLGARLDLRTRFGIGVTNLYYQDPASGTVVPFSRRHMQDAARLGQALTDFDVISTVGVIRDLPPETADLYGTLEMAANSVKPLVLLVSEHRCFERVLDLLTRLHGDLAAHPFCIPYVNPITPLVLNTETTDKIFATIARGLPFIYSNYGMSGASTPITAAGTLALLTAELLAGLVFSQLVKKGTPVILGSLPAVFDMQTMASRYTHQAMLLNLACAEMMAYYELPHAGTSGSGPGWGADLPAGGMLWMNHLSACMGRVGLAPFVGGNFNSLAFSPEMVVYSNEVIRQARLFARGFTLDDASAVLDEIKSIGPGGDFLAAPSTVKLCRKLHYTSTIWPSLTLEQWQQQGRPQAGDLLRRHTRRLLENLAAPADHADLMAAGEAFIAAS